jgi:hypothetical protein
MPVLMLVLMALVLPGLAATLALHLTTLRLLLIKHL